MYLGQVQLPSAIQVTNLWHISENWNVKKAELVSPVEGCMKRLKWRCADFFDLHSPPEKLYMDYPIEQADETMGEEDGHSDGTEKKAKEFEFEDRKPPVDGLPLAKPEALHKEEEKEEKQQDKKQAEKEHKTIPPPGLSGGSVGKVGSFVGTELQAAIDAVKNRDAAKFA